MYRITTIAFSGLEPADLDNVSLRWLKVQKFSGLSHPHRIKGTNRYELLAYTTGKLQITVADKLLSKLRSIELRLPGRRIEIDPSHATDEVSIQSSDGKTIYQFNRPLLAPTSILFDQLGLWVSIAVLFFITAFLLKRQKVCRVVSYALLGAAHRQTRHPLIWLMSGLIVMAIALGLLEIRQPLYFVQDDNYVQFLPVVLNGCKSALQGIAPLYNPFQLLGAPTATVGCYAFTYPLTIASYAAASALGQPTWLFELFAMFHLLSAYAIVFFLLSSYRVRGSLCMCGALSYALSGFFLIAGRSWYYMLPVAAWAPLLVVYTERLVRRRISIEWVMLGGIALGTFFHAGNAQMWFYTILLCGISVSAAVLSKTVSIAKLKPVIPTMLIGLGICFPLLYLQFLETRDAWRHHDPGDIAGVSFLHMLLPLGRWTSQPMPQQFPFEACHFGILFGAPVIAALLVILVRCTAHKNGPHMFLAIVKNNIWLLSFVVATLLACGSEGVLWELVSWMPVLNKFTQSAKLLAFVALFGIILSSVMVERVCLLLRARGSTDLLISGSCLIGLLFHLSQCNSAFYSYADAPSYPTLSDDLRKHFQIDPTDINKTGRILAIAPDRNAGRGYVESFTHNFPTLYNVLSMTGMDLLVATNPQTIKVFERTLNDPESVAKRFGVRWIVVHKSVVEPTFGEVPWTWRYEGLDYFQRKVGSALLPRCDKVADLETVTIYRYPQAQPLAFVEGKEQHSVPARVNASGFDLDVAAVHQNEQIVLGFLARPWLKAFADGIAVEIRKDEFERIRIRLPRKAKNLSIVYQPPVELGFAGGLFLLLLGCALALRWLPSTRV
ncbi:MAG: hypothetical protein K2X93_23520 [Candidatus Obscuribacterales bacterium]|nr:hypothetical protein [Candidatus Obscuribacterales bacterium]